MAPRGATSSVAPSGTRLRRRDAAAVAVLWGLLGAGAGAVEGVVRAVERSYFFNTVGAFTSFLVIPAVLYALVALALGWIVFLLLSLRPRGPRPSALAAALAAAPSGLVLVYWASSLYERLRWSSAGPSILEVALDAALVAAALLVFVLVRARAARALDRAPAFVPRLVRATALGAAGAVLAAGLGGSWLFLRAPGGARPAASWTPSRPLNVLLVVIDTMRADHLGCYGYPLERSPKGDRLGTSPVMDRLAAQGARFDAAITPQVVTDPSHASLFTSLYPMEHGVTRNAVRLSDRWVTLAEVMSANAYRTAAAVSVEHLDGYSSGMSQGFSDYFDCGPHDRFRHHVGWQAIPKPLKDRILLHDTPAEAANERAVRWLRRARERPFFLWVHYFEPHAPYESHEAPGVFYDPFALDGPAGEGSVDPAALAAWAQALYDSEIRHADDALGRLLEELEEMGDLERTLVIVLSDHGEHMAEERLPRRLRFSHSDVYEETARVPLIIWRPGLIAPTVVPREVSIMDIGPTILHLVGAEGAVAGTAGRSFAALLTGGAWQPRALVTDSNPHMNVESRSLRTGGWKLITRPGGVDELFDLSEDPGEVVNLAHTETSALDSLRAALDEVVSGWSGGEAAAEPDERTREMLRALGYLH